MVTDNAMPNPVPLFSIETPFELSINDLPALAEKPDSVTSHPLSIACDITLFSNSTDSFRSRSLNLLS